MSEQFELIRSRHQRLESMTSTLSPELTQELRSQAHKDRAWLLEALESATQQNDELTRELGRLDAAVDALGAAEPRKKKRVKAEEAAA